MKTTFNHAAIWWAIDEIAHMNLLTPSGLAKKAGLDATAFNKSKRFNPYGAERWPGMETLAAVMNTTGTSPQQFQILLNWYALKNKDSVTPSQAGPGTGDAPAPRRA